MDDESTHKCAECSSEIHIGVDVWQLAEGVLGNGGFVPLEDPILLCSDDCVKKYFDDEHVYRFPRKIP